MPFWSGILYVNKHIYQILSEKDFSVSENLALSKKDLLTTNLM
jgi:hypothetical protein